MNESEFIRADRIMNDPIEKLVLQTSQYVSNAPMISTNDKA